MALNTLFTSSGEAEDDKQHPLETQPMRFLWLGLRRRRILLVVLILSLAYVFVKNIPTDVPPVGIRYNENLGSLASGHTKAQAGFSPQNDLSTPAEPPPGAGPVAAAPAVTEDVYHGPIRFLNLARTLRPFMARPSINSVLFVLPDAHSAGRLLPLACRMVLLGRNEVHVALMGKQEVSAEELMLVNGISMSDCAVVWHDARPDYVQQSAPDRIAASIEAATQYLDAALSPQILLADDIGQRDESLMRAVRKAAKKVHKPLITLPKGPEHESSWLALLDSQSLKRITDVHIDIVVQATSESSGSLIRLLRSIQRAHYGGLPKPRITVELPAAVDPALTNYLSRFKWPASSPDPENQLVLRRSINVEKVNPASAALHTIQSFYSAAPSTSHVLVLSPEIELSPSYYQYLMLTLLEYKYGSQSGSLSRSLAGISLAMPVERLDGSEPFVDTSITAGHSVLLSQSPNSHAGLYFGDYWNELHAFIRQRLVHDPKMKVEASLTGVAVSSKYPAWIRPALESMKARGLYMLYPAFAAHEGHSLAMPHRDLATVPEEYADEADASLTPLEGLSNILKDDTLVFSTDRKDPFPPENILAKKISVEEVIGLDTSSFQPASAVLPQLAELPLFGVMGEVVEFENVRSLASQFARQFSLEVGGCSSSSVVDASRKGTTEDLFCEPG